MSQQELTQTEMVAYDRARELSEQFAEIERRTQDGNKVTGVVESIDMASRNGSVVVSVDVPAEDGPVTFNLKRPKVWSTQYDFVKWVTHHGYAASDFGDMVKEEVNVDVEIANGDYGLVIPRSRRETARSSVRRWKQRVGEELTEDSVLPLGMMVSVVSVYLVIAAVFATQGDVTLLDALAASLMATFLLGATAFVSFCIALIFLCKVIGVDA